MKLLQEKGMMEQIATQVVAFNDELQSNPKITIYEKQLKETQKAIENLLRAVEQGLFNSSTQERMLQLESDKADLIWRIDGEKMTSPLKLDYLEIVYWFKQFTSGDINDEKFRERLIDAFVNKVILWNDHMIIVYNIKGIDNEKLTVEEILNDFENESNIEKFDSQPSGSPSLPISEHKVKPNYWAFAMTIEYPIKNNKRDCNGRFTPKSPCKRASCYS